MKSFATLSLFIIASMAQSETSQTQSNPYIPNGISKGCSDYLTSLNNNSSFSSCTSRITLAASAFSPSSTSSSINSTTISTTLNELCSASASSGCSESTVRAQLMSYYSACSAELTTNVNTDVLRTYDVLYALTPLTQSICSKSDNGQYCVTQLNSTSSSSGTGTGSSTTSSIIQTVSQYLYITSSVLTRRDVSTTNAGLIPNTTTFRDTNLLFLFRQPDMPSSLLCTTCTRNILTSYITFESNLPYAPGLNNSLILCGQSALYNATVSQCPAGFLSGAVQAAGGLANGLLSGASRSISADVSLLAGATLGAAGLAIAAL